MRQVVNIRKLCNKCGYIIEKNQSPYFIFMGNPFITCPNCNYEQIDPYVKEFVMWDFTDYFKYFNKGLSISAIFGSIIGFFIWKIYGESEFVYFIIPFAIIFFIVFIFFIKKYNEEKNESIKRIKNIFYLNKIFENNLISAEKYYSTIKEYNIKHEVFKKENKDIKS